MKTVSYYGDGSTRFFATPGASGASVSVDIFSTSGGSPNETIESTTSSGVTLAVAPVAGAVVKIQYSAIPEGLSSGAVDVRAFGAGPDKSHAENTVAVQAACDAAYAAGGGDVLVSFVCGISAAIIGGPGLRLRGVNGGKLVQYTDNVPIVSMTKHAAFNHSWSIDGISLEYAVQQPAANTAAVGLLLATANKMSFQFSVKNTRIAFAAKGVHLPELAGCHGFLAKFENVELMQCSDYGFEWRGDTAGANTNLSLDGVWCNNVAGSEIAGAKGFLILRTYGLDIRRAGCDHLRGAPIRIETCYGSVGTMWVESCDLALAAGADAAVTLSNCYFDIDLVYFVGNNITLTGSAEFYMVYLTSGSKMRIGTLSDLATNLTTWSAGAYQVLNPGAGSTIEVERFDYAAGSPAAPNGQVADFGVVKKVRRFNGNNLTEVRGGMTETFGTAVPESGAWLVGDKIWNTTPAAGGVLLWVCTAAGTPGTWKAVEVAA
jgi:hypothetical protein